MINFLKKNKTFSLCLLITIICFVVGILFNTVIDENSKKEISTNIINMQKNISRNKFNLELILSNVFNNFSFIGLLWLFGMAVIGIPIVIFLYAMKVFIFAFELVSLLVNLHLNNIFFIIVYMCPKLLNLIIYFILLYYAINYSLVLSRLLFFKKNYNIRIITKRYLKVLGLCLLCSLVSALFESLILSKILLILV